MGCKISRFSISERWYWHCVGRKLSRVLLPWRVTGQGVSGAEVRLGLQRWSGAVIGPSIFRPSAARQSKTSRSGGAGPRPMACFHIVLANWISLRGPWITSEIRWLSLMLLWGSSVDSWTVSSRNSRDWRSLCPILWLKRGRMNWRCCGTSRNTHLEIDVLY